MWKPLRRSIDGVNFAPQTKDCFGSASDAEWVTVPAWKDLPWLRSGFSLRRPGASVAYGPGEANMGWTREDDPDDVRRNRRRFLDGIGRGLPLSLFTIGQIHSGIVHDLTGSAEKIADGPTNRKGEEPSPPGGPQTLAGDGIIGAQPGQLLGILTADCVPVLLVDRRTRVVGAFHAGWRGTLARIVETGVGIFRTRHGSRPEDLLAAIGPSIRPCCFEVGAEVQSSFEAEFTYAPELFKIFKPSQHGTGPHLDLQEANRRQLLHSGISAESIHIVAECTSCSRDATGRRRYFSYRAEGGVTGRMLSAIGTVKA